MQEFHPSQLCDLVGRLSPERSKLSPLISNRVYHKRMYKLPCKVVILDSLTVSINCLSCCCNVEPLSLGSLLFTIIAGELLDLLPSECCFSVEHVAKDAKFAMALCFLPCSLRALSTRVSTSYNSLATRYVIFS